MMMHMKKINQDYLHVGWYQACELGAFVTSEFVLAQHGYQDSIEESIVLIYGMLISRILIPYKCLA